MANAPTTAELQALIQQLQAQVQALQNAAATAAPAAPAATTAAPSVVVFEDTPQMLGAEDLIDYSTKRGSDIYKQGIAPLDDKALTDGFAMTTNQTVVFTEAFLSRATAMGWNKGSKQITTFINSSGVSVDIIKSYGQIDEATLKTACERFCKAGEADAESTAMSTPSTASSTPPSCTKLLCASPPSTASPPPKPCGTTCRKLLARGATLDDPIGILFEAYLLVPCYNFVKYIGMKHDEYLDGNLAGLTHEAMMSMAKRKFDFLKTKGKWGAKSPDD